MPGKELKDLYMAKSLAELRDKTKITKLDHPPKKLQISAELLRGNAEAILSKGDEEMSYILFMRFVEIALHVKKMKGVSLPDFEEMFGGQNVKDALNKLEKLHQSLSIRYEKLTKSKETTHPAVESAPKPVEEERNKSKNNGEELSNGSSAGKQILAKLEQFSGSSISSWDLRNLIMEGKSSVLLMDTRPAADYAKSHMCFTGVAIPHSRSNLTTVINVPKDVVIKGLTPSSLEKQLPVESLIGWNKRKEADFIVLFDWNSEDSSLKSDSSVAILMEIMTKWEIDFSYKKPPIILENGYFDWVNTFPMMTTNPHVEMPSKTKGSAAIIPNNDLYLSNVLNVDDILDDLDSVVYPALVDSPPKVTAPPLDDNSASIPTVLPSIAKSGSTSEKGATPVVDRSSKPVAASASTLSSPKISLGSPVITKKSNLPSVPTEIASSESPKETPESKSDSEFIMREKRPPEAPKVEKREEESKGVKEESKGPPKGNKIPVVNRSLKSKVLQPKGDEDRGQMGSAEARRGSKDETDLEGNRKSSEVFEKQNKNANFLRDDSKEEDSCQQRKKIDKDVWTIPLNSEPSPGTSAMKRSRSLQNVSRLMDDQECPKVNRSVKPVNKTSEIISVRRRTFDGVYGNVGRGLTGLRNLGNSCYMNSILQCINHTTTLVKYFCDGRYREDVNRSTKMKGEVAEEVAALVRALWSGEYRSIACRGLKGVVGMHKKAFAGYEQQDSHEFLTILMDWLHEDLNRAGQRSIPSGAYNSEGSNQNASGIEGAVKAWKEFCSKNESLVLQLFYGQQASTVSCLMCGEESVTYEPFSNLSLPLPANATRCTLSDCMSLYLKGEHITGWNCPRCKEPRDAIKKFDIWILPQILVIHLKRFTSDGWCRKRQTMVDFPLEDLDVSLWVTMETSSGSSHPHHKRNSSHYSLYGVSNHYGTMDGGHYTAHCKSSIFNKWYKFDDHEVSELSPSDVVSPAAYILFYSSVDVS